MNEAPPRRSAGTDTAPSGIRPIVVDPARRMVMGSDRFGSTMFIGPCRARLPQISNSTNFRLCDEAKHPPPVC